jgi:4-hydroxyphenylpyruvate dioxygenase
VEFYVGDASTAARRFEIALGMPITCVSSLATGNDVCVTYGLECFGGGDGGGGGDGDGGMGNDEYDGGGDDDAMSYEPGEGVRFLFTAPLGRRRPPSTTTTTTTTSSPAGGSGPKATAPLPMPGYDPELAREFVSRHGMAVRAVGVEVHDASKAYDNAVENGARGVLPPSAVRDFNEEGGGAHEGTTTTTCRVAEVELYGDVVLRFVSFHDDDDDDDDRSRDGGSSPDRRRGRRRPFLPNLSPYPNDGRGGGAGRSDGGRGGRRPRSYGLTRIDHAVGNVPDLLESLEYIGNITGYHPFAEFASEDVGTLDSGLNSVVLASDDESVLLPLNEPTNGRRKSQIQTFLEQNDGPGMQHIAIKTRDIFGTIRHMRYAEEELGGFELMARPSDAYYRELPSRLGERLSSAQYVELEELGILADADDEGVLLQIFTKPLGDRPTLFLEIIQRIGCVLTDDDDDDDDDVDVADGEEADRGGGGGLGKGGKTRERPGCGGFGQGNFRELFKSIEDFEKTLKV